MLRIILTLFIELTTQQDLTIFCHQDENYYLGQLMVPISLQNKTNIEKYIEQNQEILQLIGKIPISNLNDKRELIYKSFYQNQLELIFLDQDHYLCKYIDFKFNFENNKFTDYKEIVKDQITFQLPLCTNFLKMYQINQQMFIFCEEEFFIQFFVLERDQGSSAPFNLKISSNSKMKKQQNCNYELSYQLYIYLTFLNCQDWVIYVIKDNNFEILIDSTYIINKILKSLSITEEILLQFESEIYKIRENYKELLYSNYIQQIINCFSQKNNQYVIFIKGENKIELIQNGLNNILLITNQQSPRQVLKLEDKLIINYGTYLEELERIDAKYILHVAIDTLINESINYPFLQGFYQNEIVLLKKNNQNPFISCNQLIKTDYIFYTTNHLFKRNQLFRYEIYFEKYHNQLSPLQIYLRNTTFSFKLYKPFITKRDESSRIQIFNNNSLNCQISQLEQYSNCENVLYSNISWYKLKYFQRETYILFQKFNSKLYIKQCNRNILMELGRFQNFEENNIYEFKGVFILIFQQQTKVLVLYFQQNVFNQKVLEFKEKIINIYYENYEVYLITNSCTSYILLSQLYYPSKNNQYIQINGQCIQAMLINDDYLSYIQEGSIIMTKKSITNIIKFADSSVVDIFKIYLYQQNYIIHFKNQDGDHFGRYLFINNQFIKLYDIPKAYYQYSSPLIYKITRYLMIVAAYGKSGIRVLLVYYFNANQFQVDHIQVDNFNFYISDEDILVYNFNKEFKMIDLKYDKVNCEVSLFSEFVQNLTFPLYLISKFDASPDFYQMLNIHLFNLIQDLSFKESISNPLILEIQNSVYHFDPRLYITGPIDQIVTTDLIIIDPIIEIGRISKVECEKFINQVCINQNGRQFIFNPFFKQEIHTLKIEINYEIKIIRKFQDLIFILCQNQDQFTIQVYNTLEQYSYFLQIPHQCSLPTQMQIYLNFYILLCSHMISFYKIYDHVLEPFSSLQIVCFDCSLMEITNSKDALLYLPSNNKVQEIFLITIYDDIHHDYSNRTSLQIFKLISEKLSDFTIQNITFVDSSYYEILILKQEVQGFLYYLQGILDKNEGIVKFKQDSMLIRHFQYLDDVKSIQFLSKDIILLRVKVTDTKYSIQIYNISNAFNLKEIDYIFNLQLNESQNLLRYDDYHFILDSSIEEEYRLYKVVPYELMLKGQQNDNMIIEFQNSVSSLKLQVKKTGFNSFYINDYFISIVIVFAILIFFLLKCLSRNKYLPIKKQQEIEL